MIANLTRADDRMMISWGELVEASPPEHPPEGVDPDMWAAGRDLPIWFSSASGEGEYAARSWTDPGTWR